tara:strand:+ start:25661 stop:26512 length:852 start_codon:yes stop_codon:yes gene_type:complete
MSGKNRHVITQEQHAHLSTSAKILGAEVSKFRNNVSSHKCNGPISFSTLQTFCVNATKPTGVGASELFVSSLDGAFVISARGWNANGSDPTVAKPDKKKRARDDASDRAEAACARLVNIATKLAFGDMRRRNLAQLASARNAIENMLRNVRGPNDVDIIESIGVSLASDECKRQSNTTSMDNHKEYANDDTAETIAQESGTEATIHKSKRPKVLLAARLSAGVPISIKTLKDALGPCFMDGMLTLHPEGLGPAYQLPQTDQSRAAESEGQRSILVFAAVPLPP